MIDRKFCIPNFKRLNSNQNALLGQRKLTIRGVQKTDEPNKLVETDQIEFNFSIRFWFDLISVSFFKNQNFRFQFQFPVCMHRTDQNQTE